MMKNKSALIIWPAHLLAAIILFYLWRAVLFIAAVFILRHLLFSAAIILCLFISAR